MKLRADPPMAVDRKDDGGPAFPAMGKSYLPTPFEGDGTGRWVPSWGPGMSLRDWLAGQALPWCLGEFGGSADDQTQAEEAAYQIADRMLAQRAKTGAGR